MNIICSILLALTYVSTPAKAAHRLSDEQILEVIRSAPSGAAVTVPADFFRDVIAGKFRWRNATNWIARASGDNTMVKAFDSMNQEMDLANKSNAVTQRINRRLQDRVDNFTNEMAKVVLTWEDKVAWQSNRAERVAAQLEMTKELLESTKAQIVAAIDKIYERTRERDDATARLTRLKERIIERRAEYQEKYDKGSIITKPIFKAIIEIFDKMLELFDKVEEKAEES